MIINYKCTKCNIEKSEDDYYKQKGKVTQPCKDCRNKYQKEYRKAHLESQKARQREWKRSKFVRIFYLTIKSFILRTVINMKTRTVESFEKWLIIKQYIIDNGYRSWQRQYDYSTKEGYQVRFWKANTEQIEVITHNKDIEEDIRKNSL